MDILKELINSAAENLEIPEKLLIKFILILASFVVATTISLVNAHKSKRRLRKAISQVEGYEVELNKTKQNLKKVENELLETQKKYNQLRDSTQNSFTPKVANPNLEKESVLSKIPKKSSNGDKIQEIVNSVISIYEEQKQNDVFIPITNLITGLVSHRVVSKEDFAVELLNKLVQKYPSAFRIEEIRGKIGKHIAIYKERITPQ